MLADLYLDPELTVPRVARVLKALARAASAVPALVGLLVLLGWAYDIELLKRIVPGLVAMNPTTAIGLICLALALALVDARGSALATL